MIFVTVGTHEQAFNRLIQYLDECRQKKLIREDIYIQTGFSTYEPQFCQWKKLIPYDEMVQKVKNARIVISHGGPASFLMPLQYGKIPIVVPRKKEFNEHINNHQVEFSKQVADRMGIIIPVYNINDLLNTILQYDEIVYSMSSKMNSNNEKFCSEFEKIISEIV